ncbi:hypothetical protein [Mycolicibacter sinensis]|jgi:hypothetical protein|uniref:Transmembrane protein n=1 Tax=Mycolicibacter sinensis (strain JDM601) TaxID=875328 RepID=A0A1A2ETV7_MYCSD|nr:hypothetical protein [Mycolicibacter sinensis]OBG00859.1 hypothetical protein A5771_17425 [Mycolicibacter sinensis]OBG07595.1 hypothetical protein A5772_19480 [Mycolicibacter sinensis]
MVRAPIVRGVVELILAGAAAAGCAASWLNVRYLVLVAPVTDGEPATLSVAYHPRMVLLALLLATAAGVLAVVGIARLRRARRRPGAIYPAGVSSAG